MERTTLRVKLFDDVERRQVYESVNASNAEMTEQRARSADGGPEPEVIEPVTAMLIAGGVVAVAKFVSDWIERRRGGLVLDLRPGTEHEIRRDPEVPFGFIVVIQSDGAVKIDVKDAPKDAMERLLSQIIDKTFSTAAAIAKAAGKELGDDKITPG